MTQKTAIPDFTLYGETGAFPDVVHCEDFSARAAALGWQISPHRHTRIAQLFIIKEGIVSGSVDGASIELQSKHHLYVPSQMVHRFTFEPDTTGQVVSFPLGVVNSVAPASQELRRTLDLSFQGKTPMRLQQMVTLLSETLGTSGTFRAQTALSMSHAVLSQIAQSAAEHAPQAKAKRTAKLTALDRLIARTLGDGWRASDYAAALSLSTGHLSRLCRTATGMGAALYIEQMRMEEACRLLAFTQLTISEIGYRLGFDDPSYFSKRFRAARHQTPTAYRDQFSG